MSQLADSHSNDPFIVLLRALEKERLATLIRLEKVELETALARSEASEAKSLMTEDSGYVSLKGFCNLKKVRLSHHELRRHGAKISAYCRMVGIEIKDITSEMWGTVHTYPKSLLEKWFSSLEGHF